MQVQGRRSPWLRWLLLGLVLAAMPVVVVCGSDAEPAREAGDATGESQASVPEAERQSPDPSAGIRALGVSDGDCMNFSRQVLENVELVPCTSDWEYRVLSSFDVDREGEYPGEDYLGLEASYKCDLQYSHYTRPTVESWQQGTRVITCFQQSFDLLATDPERLEAGADVLLRAPTTLTGG